jgi:hypothetical protein
LYVHMIWINNKPYKSLMEGIKAYVNKHAYKHTYKRKGTLLYLWSLLRRNSLHGNLTKKERNLAVFMQLIVKDFITW